MALGTIAALYGLYQGLEQQYGNKSGGLGIEGMAERHYGGKRMMEAGESPEEIAKFMYAGRPGFTTKPSLGLEGQAAAQEQARAMQSILNQNLMGSTIPMINREYAGAGRYASGQRLGAIGRATQQSQGMLGQQIGMNALQVYLAQLQAQEERDWRQAQLDLAGTQQESAWGGLGQLAPYLIPYLLGEYGGGAPIGGGSTPYGGGSSALTQAYAGYKY